MPELNDNDDLSRFAYEREHIRADGTVRSQFMKPKRGEPLSVFEVNGFVHPEICNHGRIHSDNPAKKRIHIGYAVLKCRAVREEGLDPIYDDPLSRHVSIPFNTDDIETRLAYAQALSIKASLFKECKS